MELVWKQGILILPSELELNCEQIYFNCRNLRAVNVDFKLNFSIPQKISNIFWQPKYICW